MAWSSLHTDVMLDFFSRLTVKGLHRCRCVSREWLSVISNPNLRTLHRQRWRQHPLMLVLDNINSTTYVITVSDMGGAVLNHFIVDLPVTSSFAIIGYTYCELICFSLNHDKLYVCNPSTQELAEVPSSPYSFRFSASLPPMGFFTLTKQHHILAIGRVPSLDQYKIVRLFMRNVEKNGAYDFGCEVFTIRDGEHVDSGSWKLIGDCPCSVSQTSHASVEGAIYWPVADHALRSQRNHILRLDLETEMFEFISGPQDYLYGLDHEDDDFISFSLQELKGCVCLVNRYQPFFVLDVWMLKDRANGIWVKEHHIDLPPLDHHCMIQGFIPSNHDDGNLLIFMSSNQTYYYYNIQTQTFSVADNLNAEGLHSFFVYYDNFFSLGTR
ncbi:hypothetical protein VitviT2T_000708 [Vitis vinifera]|uniref:F-box protein n=1 Tax=Vitis vinifera TaxID=29760 RepID=A0ABY9BES6_VITVI|nr:F-box protein At5g65850-like [Vitis vinifera]WJZ80825.1 hypothetical protein VitviT2T_000708 [Vitis vinifera]|eukprot:XP_010651754.1 PREDICTED: F-box protein At5g65850-like [Vitis vinifera]